MEVRAGRRWGGTILVAALARLPALAGKSAQGAPQDGVRAAEPVDTARLLLGDVVDREGQPLAGVMVHVAELRPADRIWPDAMHRAGWGVVGTSGTGRFVVEGARPGVPYELRVLHGKDGEPLVATAPVVLRAGAPPVEVVARHHAVRVRVLDPAGRPVEAGGDDASRESSLRLAAVRRAGARSRVRSVSPGEWIAWVEPGVEYAASWWDGVHSLVEERVRVPSGAGPADVVLRLREPSVPATLSVTVVAPGEGRVATQDDEAIELTVRSPGGERVLVSRERRNPCSPFELTLPPGEYALEARGVQSFTGFCGVGVGMVFVEWTGERRAVSVRPGARLAIALDLERAGRVRPALLLPDTVARLATGAGYGDSWGQWLLDVDVHAVDGLEVSDGARDLRPVPLHPGARASTPEAVAAGGAAREVVLRTLEPLRPGDYRVAVRAPGCAPAEVAVRVGAGEDTPVRVALVPEASPGG